MSPGKSEGERNGEGDHYRPAGGKVNESRGVCVQVQGAGAGKGKNEGAPSLAGTSKAPILEP